MFGIGRGRGRGNLGRTPKQDGDRSSPFTTSQSSTIALVQPFDKSFASSGKPANLPQAQGQFNDSEVARQGVQHHRETSQDVSNAGNRSQTSHNYGTPVLPSPRSTPPPGFSSSSASQLGSSAGAPMPPPGFGGFPSTPFPSAAFPSGFSPLMESTPLMGFQQPALLNPSQSQRGRSPPGEELSLSGGSSSHQFLHTSQKAQSTKPIPHLFSPDELIRGLKADIHPAGHEKVNVMKEHGHQMDENGNQHDVDGPQKKGKYIPPPMRKKMDEESDISGVSGGQTWEQGFQQAPHNQVGERHGRGAHNSSFSPYGKPSPHPHPSRESTSEDSERGIPLREVLQQQQKMLQQQMAAAQHIKQTQGKETPEWRKEKQDKEPEWRKAQQSPQNKKQVLQRTATGHHYSQKPLLSEEKVVKAELEWKKWKLQHGVKRMFKKSSEEEFDSIPEELKACLAKNKLSEEFPGLSDCGVLMEVVFEHVLEKPSSSYLGCLILKALYGLQTNDFADNLKTIFKIHRDELEQGHSLSDIFARVKAFCIFGGMLFAVAKSDGFQAVLESLIKENLARWLNMLKGSKYTNSTQSSVLADCFSYMSRMVGRELEDLDRETMLQFIEVTRECVLMEKLSKSVRSSLLDVLLAQAAGWPELDIEKELEGEEESDVIIESEDSTSTNQDETNQDDSNHDNDPYHEVKTMLSELNLEDMLNRFEVNCIRDSSLCAEKDDLKLAFQEAGFPPGVILEMQMYLSEHRQRIHERKRSISPKSFQHEKPASHRSAVHEQEGSLNVQKTAPEKPEHKQNTVHQDNRLNTSSGKPAHTKNAKESSGQFHPMKEGTGTHGEAGEMKSGDLPWRQRPLTSTSNYKPPAEHFPSLEDSSQVPRPHSQVPSVLTPGTVDQGGYDTDSEDSSSCSDESYHVSPIQIHHAPPVPVNQQLFVNSMPVCCSCGSDQHRTWQCKDRSRDFGFQ